MSVKIELIQILKVARYGNSLWLRIDRKAVEKLGIKEGDEFLLYLTEDGCLLYKPKRVGEVVG